MKQYVFWRTSTGRPAKRGTDGHAPSEVLSEIGTTARVTPDGRIQWSGLEIVRLEQAVFGSAVVVDPDKRELNEHDARKIVWTAAKAMIKASGGGKALNAELLLERADKEAAAFFRRTPDAFVLISSLPVRSFPANAITVDGCRISPLQSRNRFPIPHSLEWHRKQSGVNIAEQRHQLVRVRTSGRSTFEAADRALEALALLCGIWNLCATYGAWTVMGGRQTRRPIGVVHVGPYHTLHRLNGEVVDDVYWYEPDYGEHRSLFDPKGGWPKLEKERRWVTRRLGHLPYASDLRSLLIRFATALSKTDMGVAFLQMWSILEAVTDTVGSRYQDTIDRATWGRSDARIARELLEYLRCCRNRYVHAAKSDDDTFQVAQLVKAFLEPHFIDLLHNRFCVKSIKEYGACLGLPASMESLREHLRRYSTAIRVRKSWSKAT